MGGVGGIAVLAFKVCFCGMCFEWRITILITLLIEGNNKNIEGIDLITKLYHIRHVRELYTHRHVRAVKDLADEVGHKAVRKS